MKKIILSLFFITFVTALYSEKSYRILSRGAVRDNSTNLIWTRCPLTDGDQPIYDFQCDGGKKLYSWSEAVDVCKNLVFEGRSDWRLPNITELQSIVFSYHYVTGEAYYSQVSDKVFPNTISKSNIFDSCTSDTCYLHYWSSTPALIKSGSVDMAWTINFCYGDTFRDIIYLKDWGGNNITDKPKKKAVRCVAGP